MKILFLNVNGSGLGHLNRCLSYALRLPNSVSSIFFSLASAVEIIQSFGFEADYFVSPYWSNTTSYAWNSELAIRFGMMLERVRPDVIVFDGTWPFQGFLTACKAYSGKPKIVWSKRGLIKSDVNKTSVSEDFFDLIIEPGEVGDLFSEFSLLGGSKKIHIPPVSVLDNDEVLDRQCARDELGLSSSAQYALFSLGPGNLKDHSSIGSGLIALLLEQGFQIIWAKSPISVHDLELPAGVNSISAYPLVKYMKAFDVFIGAAGYNTCCEVVQAQVPALLVPNAQLADDQRARANSIALYAPVVVSQCETTEEQVNAVTSLMDLLEDIALNTSLPAEGRTSLFVSGDISAPSIHVPLNGAALAANAIYALATGRSQ